jgi:hypothetical protein
VEGNSSSLLHARETVMACKPVRALQGGSMQGVAFCWSFQEFRSSSEKMMSIQWHYLHNVCAEVMMEWWVLAVELGVPVIIGLAIYLTLRK